MGKAQHTTGSDPTNHRTVKGGNSRLLTIVAVSGVLALATVNHFVSSQVQQDDDAAEDVAATNAVRVAQPKPDPVLPDQNFIENPKAASQRVERIARESGGDWNKVSPGDQRMLDSLTSGNGPAMLRRTVEKLKQRDGTRERGPSGEVGTSSLYSVNRSSVAPPGKAGGR